MTTVRARPVASLIYHVEVLRSQMSSEASPCSANTQPAKATEGSFES